MRAIADQRDPSLRDALREGGVRERKQHSKSNNNMERESGELFLFGTGSGADTAEPPKQN
jgi:hypothetical protein